jgi:hypothetical protein
MAVLFGNLGDGSAMRAFGTVAAATCLAAIAFGAQAERYAELHRAALPLTSTPEPGLAQLPQPLDGVDYAGTGSFSRSVDASLSGPERVATLWASAEKSLYESSATLVSALISLPDTATLRGDREKSPVRTGK